MKNNLTAKAPRYGFSLFFLFFKKKKKNNQKSVIDLIWNTKNRNDQALRVDLFSVQKSVSSAEFCRRGWGAPPPHPTLSAPPPPPLPPPL